MVILNSLDALVNFIPRLPERIIDYAVRGPDALALLPIVAIGYIGGCAAQGAAVGYAVSASGGTTKQAIFSAALTTIMPPIVKTLSIFYS